jgi:hypothetical protein
MPRLIAETNRWHQNGFYGDEIMKYKVIALLLALTMMSWAQSPNTSQPPTNDQNSENAADKKATPCCCDKMSAEHKDGQACVHDKGCCSGKQAASCCNDKEAKACMKGDKTADCCANGKCNDKKMSCCSTKKEQKAESCCPGMQCGKSDHTHRAG